MKRARFVIADHDFVELLARDGPRCHKLLCPGQVSVKPFGSCVHRRQIAFGLFQVSLVRAGIDFEEHVILINKRALHEIDLVEIPEDSRADFD